MNPNPGSIDWVWEHVQTHPPRCLSGVVVRRYTETTRATVAWEITHPDPTQRPVLLGHFMNKRWPDYCAPYRGLILLSPLMIRWQPCGEEVVIYDGAKHGYNPEYDIGPVHTTGWKGRAVWLNPNGPSVDPVFVASFSYDFWPEYFESDTEMARRPQDFFDWYSLDEVDRQTGRITAVTNYECA